MDHCHHW